MLKPQFRKSSMKLHDYQIEAKRFVMDSCLKKRGAGLWLDCGLGKTAVSLHAIKDMLDLGIAKSAAVIAPSRVITTSWPKEIEQWGLDLSWSWLGGDEEKRAKALSKPVDIHFVNTESFAIRNYSNSPDSKRIVKLEQIPHWLKRIKWRPDLIFVDESTKFKAWDASRSKVLRSFLKHDPMVVTLTGTPMPNSMEDIFSQQFLIDRGATLSPYITHFRTRFMRSCGFEGRDWEMRPDKVDELNALLAPWYLHQSALDHLDMPELVLNEIDVHLPPAALKKYKQMEKEMFTELDAMPDPLVAMSGGSKYNLCRQMASGNVYDSEKNAYSVHDAKLEAIDALWEELNYKPLLVAYWYQHEYERLAKKFPMAQVINGSTSASKLKAIIAGWIAGTIPMIILQAGSASHGIDGLQKNGNDLVWYTLTDQPEVRYQLERRLFRQGVKGDQVRIHYLLAVSTIDKTVYRTLNLKSASEKDVIQAVKGFR